MPKTQESTSSTVATAVQTVVHLVSQTKGGVGKSVVASWIGSYLKDSPGEAPFCYDADPGNRTFARFKSLDVKVLELMREGDVDPALYDNLIEAILTVPGKYVIDTGASSFLGLWNYIHRNELFNVLDGAGADLIVHVPLAAEPDLVDTVDGFSRIASLAPEQSVVLWMNQRTKRIEHGGVDVLDLDAIKQHKSKLRGVVVNSRQLYPLHRDTVNKMLHSNACFSDSFGLNSMERMRLEQVKSEVYKQLEGIGL